MGGSSANVAQSATPTINNAQSALNASNNPQVLQLLQGVQNGTLNVSQALQQAGNLSAGSDPNAAQRASLTSQIQALQNGGASTPNSSIPSAMPGGGNSTGLNATPTASAADQAKNISALQQQLNALGAAPNSGLLQQGATDAIGANAITGNQLAAQQVQNGALTKGLFGAGGIQDQSQAQVGTINNNLTSDRQSLSGNDQSYGLTPQDLAAYGQESNQVNQQFANQNNSLAEQLQARGLGTADSGAAAATYAGSYGNQLEQLAGLQNTIAQQRIQTAQSLAQARTNADLQQQGQNNSMVQGLGQLGTGLQQQQYQNQVGQQANDINQQMASAGLASNDQQLQQNINNSQWTQNQQSSFNLGNALGGLAGGALGAATGGLGSSLGKALGGSTLGSVGAQKPAGS